MSDSDKNSKARKEEPATSAPKKGALSDLVAPTLVSKRFSEDSQKILKEYQLFLNDKSIKDLLRSYESRDVISKDIAELRKQIATMTGELQSERASGRQHQQRAAAFESLVAQLKVKEDLGFLLTRVGPEAQERLIREETFREIFTADRDCDAFVMSVDIRRSTELMLKARSPSMFADFISRLTKELYRCVLDNNGVLDKFTGDGILAFFPEQFSGPDFGYSVVKAAHQCHKAFEAVYRESRSSFASVLKDVGLGIGIDFGTVRLLRVAEGLTVVGVPVVYACRLSGSDPGTTLLNQPAFEMISSAYGGSLDIEESSLSIKHEGEVLAYRVALTHKNFEPRSPDWMGPKEVP